MVDGEKRDIHTERRSAITAEERTAVRSSTHTVRALISIGHLFHSYFARGGGDSVTSSRSPINRRPLAVRINIEKRSRRNQERTDREIPQCLNKTLVTCSRTKLITLKVS